MLDSLPQPLRRQLKSGAELAQSQLARARRRPQQRLTTTVAALDRALGGGLPRGGTVELVGWRSSGRFSTVLAALAAATRVGEAAALVDLGDHLDPRTAESAGVSLERLLWLRPKHLRDALKSTEMLLDSGFPLVVLELGDPPLGRRGAESFWLRLVRAAEARDAALLVSSPYRISGTGADAVMEMRRLRPAWGSSGGPRLLQGLEARLSLTKRRGVHGGETERLTLRAPEAPMPPVAPTAHRPSQDGAQASPPRPRTASFPALVATG
ncbi:MAG: hypothetical protein SX243_11440 [Acidobacteriota bacterium]|nr:hypothetical protein [Acidobacteriota bacterium]